MNKAEAFFQALEIVPNAVWFKEFRGNPTKGSYLMINGNHAAYCLRKLGKYYIMGSKEWNTNISSRWVVNTDSKEVRILPTTHKIRGIEEILRP